MNTIAYYKTEISNLLSGFSLQQAEEIYPIVKKKRLNNDRSSKKSLSGIWKDVNADELEVDLKELRQTLPIDLENKPL
ncbi:MAG: hypothetical protein RO257_06485 [Candidatus Kapabacteria bacterium]|nr:hypothetical protein [Candidatus Kapabacteria bacterium]